MDNHAPVYHSLLGRWTSVDIDGLDFADPRPNQEELLAAAQEVHAIAEWATREKARRLREREWWYERKARLALAVRAKALRTRPR